MNLRHLALAIVLSTISCKVKDTPPSPPADAAGDAEFDGASSSPDAAFLDAGAAVDSAPDVSDETPALGKALGTTCNADGECASVFCIDHVCCNTRCDAQCYGCDQATTSGVCTALNGADDLSALVSCAGLNTCSADESGGVACKPRDGQPCNSSQECASGVCRTYYPDRDGDGYGTATNSIARCDAAARPPAGYSAVAGDCCDLDAQANPSVTAYFQLADACGSYDWDCKNGAEKQGAGFCPGPGVPGAVAIACGDECSFGASGHTAYAFTQACH
jgi:hypothetical protein